MQLSPFGNALQDSEKKLSNSAKSSTTSKKSSSSSNKKPVQVLFFFVYYVFFLGMAVHCEPPHRRGCKCIFSILHWAS